MQLFSQNLFALICTFLFQYVLVDAIADLPVKNYKRRVDSLPYAPMCNSYERPEVSKKCVG